MGIFVGACLSVLVSEIKFTCCNCMYICMYILYTFVFTYKFAQIACYGLITHMYSNATKNTIPVHECNETWKEHLAIVFRVEISCLLWT